MFRVAWSCRLLGYGDGKQLILFPMITELRTLKDTSICLSSQERVNSSTITNSLCYRTAVNIWHLLSRGNKTSVRCFVLSTKRMWEQKQNWLSLQNRGIYREQQTKLKKHGKGFSNRCQTWNQEIAGSSCILATSWCSRSITLVKGKLVCLLLAEILVSIVWSLTIGWEALLAYCLCTRLQSDRSGFEPWLGACTETRNARTPECRNAGKPERRNTKTRNAWKIKKLKNK